MKKQTTRMRKLQCDTCDWTCRTTAKHIVEVLACPVAECGGALRQ